VPSSPAPTVFIVYRAEGAKPQAFRLAEWLRANGVASDLTFGDRALRKQFASADRSGAPFAVVVGDEAASDDALEVKDLRSGEQMQVTRAELLTRLRASDGTTE